jgi:hypothetical protein
LWLAASMSDPTIDAIASCRRLDVTVERLTGAAAEACEREPRWADSVRAGIEVLLEFVAVHAPGSSWC